MIKNKLEIFLITYNRKNKLKHTLKELLDITSPIKEVNITILDNCSTDGTSELIQEYCQKYPNLKHIRHSVNIGGVANIARAFEMASSCDKDYFWILCDDDRYNFKKWDEVEELIDKNADVILLERKFKLNIKTLPFYTINSSAFLPSCIYKTANLTSQVLQNIYFNSYNSLAHMSLIINLVNEHKTFAIAPKIIIQEINNNFRRGCCENISYRQKMLDLFTSPIDALQLIKNKKMRADCCEHVWQNRPFLDAAIDACKSQGLSFRSITETLFNLTLTQRIKFVLAYIIAHPLYKSYKYWNIQYKEDWLEYLKKVNEQKYINKLAKKLKNKEIILYGAGLLSELICDNYDLSKLNIVGIADKKFENENPGVWQGYKTYKPNEILDKAGVILIGLKCYNNFEYKFRVKKKLDVQIFSLVKRCFYYPIGTMQYYNKTIAKYKRMQGLKKYKKFNVRKKLRKKENSNLIGKIFQF